MQKLRKFFALVLPLLLFSPTIAGAQSDSQTLRSPYASLVGIADFDFGLPAGSGLKYPLSLGGNLIGGYQINKLFTLGVGVGIHGYGPDEMLLLPMFVDARLHFPQKKWTPYVTLDLGYALSLDTLQRGGFLINPTLGGRVPLTNNTAFAFGIGLRMQQNKAWVDDTLEDFVPNYLSVKLGVVVKLPRLSRKVFKQTMHRMKDKTKREK